MSTPVALLRGQNNYAIFGVACIYMYNDKSSRTQFLNMTQNI